jgi:hypothetical protein
MSEEKKPRRKLSNDDKWAEYQRKVAAHEEAIKKLTAAWEEYVKAQKERAARLTSGLVEVAGEERP